MKKIAEVLTPTRGPFRMMNYDFEFASIQQLDILFFTSYSGRTISPIVNYHIENDEIDDTNLQLLSDEILAVYKQKWDKLKAVALLEYDPIHNFSDDIQEDITGKDDYTKDNTGTVKDTGSVSDTGKFTETGSIQNTGTIGNVASGTRNTDIYGFNSAASSDQNDELTNSNSTQTNNLNEANSLEHTNNLQRENNLTRTDALKEVMDDDYEKHRVLTRSGNIGNISYQSLLKQEIELWQWNFIRQVLEDVKDFTTLPIYSV